MGWLSIFKAGSQGGKITMSLSARLANVSSSISKWLSTTKLSSWLKVGAAGGIGYTIYHAWGSAIESISDATGLSENNVETFAFLIIGGMVVYVAIKILLPEKTDVQVVNNIPESKPAKGSSSGSSRSTKSKGGRR